MATRKDPRASCPQAEQRSFQVCLPHHPQNLQNGVPKPTVRGIQPAVPSSGTHLPTTSGPSMSPLCTLQLLPPVPGSQPTRPQSWLPSQGQTSLSPSVDTSAPSSPLLGPPLAPVEHSSPVPRPFSRPPCQPWTPPACLRDSASPPI